MKTRNAVVEGRFYPSTGKRIFDQIQEIETSRRYPETDLVPRQIFGAVLPHAGHIYSGHQTIPFFQVLNKMKKLPDTFVIVHPNHSGNGLPLAIDDADKWVNSIGDVYLDREFAKGLDLPFDRLAHAHEHSAEVIIPFLQYYLPEHPFKIVPICMGDQDHTSALLVAQSILSATRITGRNILVLSSCDFSHFLSPAEGKEKDQQVLDEILARNPTGVERAVRQHHVSVCG
ncbi:MAG: AmmeMemoRadiSam system protein B, partial [Bacteroidales bacterium]|nr:AmmeMemoRadiSam system protein B [Bacteroidales bacterium]